ncbi:hypothetical protein GCM10011390_07730 [Aureimonas endophytica]|uniref:DUF2059 domain-containing protein n=1 Tax=Aureimonas endophytica TaxID=2027858 RepID=A0A917E223_9HYPH|nr:DUF2059 domain-containing protein [Aureimonas endophytica]GGD91421.1 hypothetical protein GCM10011390_07730 [Aureimonas endophytica]
MVLMNTIRGGILAVVVAGLAVTVPAAAQEIAPSHLAAARAAVDAIDSTEQFDNILMNAATQIKSDLIGSNPDMQPQISDMVDDKALELAPRRADLETEVSRVYAKLFTEQELKDIAAFYNSAAGKKLLKQGPIASREMLAAADVWSNGILRDLRSKAAEGMSQLLAQNGSGATLPGGAALPTTTAGQASSQ